MTTITPPYIAPQTSPSRPKHPFPTTSACNNAYTTPLATKPTTVILPINPGITPNVKIGTSTATAIATAKP